MRSLRGFCSASDPVGRASLVAPPVRHFRRGALPSGFAAVAAFLGSLLSACHADDWSAPKPGDAPGRPMTARQLDIAEAALRHLFAKNESAQGKTAVAYCVALVGAAVMVRCVRPIRRRNWCSV